MPRIVHSALKHSLCLLCFFVIGFCIGIRYWPVFVRIHCPPLLLPFPSISTTTFVYSHFSYRTIRTCSNESSKPFLTIAVLSSYERLFLYLPAILETWALNSSNEIEIIFFLEEKFNDTDYFLRKIFLQLNKKPTSSRRACIYLVKLKHVKNNYPPQKKSFYAMKYIYARYRYRTSWILRLDDNAYVHIRSLIRWLKSLDHRKTFYIGQGGSGRPNGSDIHFQPGQYFCMGGSGVILSRETLVRLGPWLDRCLTIERSTDHEDVELGRCILSHVHIGCTNAYDSKILFYHHYGPSYEFGIDFTPSIVSHALILHPINNRTTFRQLYAFHLRQQQVKHNLSSWPSSHPRIYTTFLSKIEFDLVRDVHYQPIDVRWKIFIENNVRSYIEQLRYRWHHRSNNWTLTNGKILFGYHREIPAHGSELIVEVMLAVQFLSMPSRQQQPTAIRKRFHLRQSFIGQHHFVYREITDINLHGKQQQLNLVVVSNDRDPAFSRFLRNFEREVLQHSHRHAHFTLTTLYFWQKNSSNVTLELARQFTVRYPSIVRLSIVNRTQQIYNRGLGRQLASQIFTSNQLLFFLDVDLVFTGQALDSTRRLMIHQLSVSSCAVYFPIVYSHFSHMFTTDRGLFSIYGFGNVAVRKRDLDRIGGWETNNRDWGVEDVNLFRRFTDASPECHVFRMAEPGLRHWYHRKMCNGILDTARQRMCREAEANLFGSQATMANYIHVNNILKF